MNLPGNNGLWGEIRRWFYMCIDTCVLSTGIVYCVFECNQRENTMDSSRLVLDSSINEEDDATRSHVLSRNDAVKAARLQSPRTANVSSITSLTLERRGLRSVSRGSLSGLVNLVQLNLARNELTSLRGLETAVSPESLSLYHNRVAYLEELRHLIPLTKLTNLDLRLNPVTRDEAYRSYVIFHLPCLEELDERSVRPAERRHAQLAVNELDEQYHHPRGPDTDDEVESSAYDQQRSSSGSSSGRIQSRNQSRNQSKNPGITSNESKGMPMTSEEIIQDYQRSVARVKKMQGSCKKKNIFSV